MIDDKYILNIPVTPESEWQITSVKIKNITWLISNKSNSLNINKII